MISYHLPWADEAYVLKVYEFNCIPENMLHVLPNWMV